MSNPIWLINGVPSDELGLTVAAGSERTQGVSTLMLDIAKDFDQPHALSYGQTVVVARLLGGVATMVFQGKVAHPSKLASPEYEGHSYVIEDAWADLENTTYQEDWKIGNGEYKFPKAILGLKKNGDKITIGEQIREVLTYAASVGVNLQVGSVPEGEILWTEEVANISCAEVISKCLQYHPDWQPWIDHSGFTPTFNITPVNQMAQVDLSVNGSDSVSDFRFTRRDDLAPLAVRIIWEWAITIEDNLGEPQVYRNAAIQKYPEDGPDGGPGVICLTIPLEGQNMQIQKQRIKVRKMPETGDDGDLAKLWIKKQYLHLKNVPIEEFAITSFTKELLVADPDDEDEEDPDPISSQALRLIPDDVDEVPNQLVEGQIEDWMRKKVGYVNFEVSLALASGASSETRSAFRKGFPPGRTLATNAVTKLYKGITQWAPETEIPEGIAEGVCNSAVNAYLFEGWVKQREVEIGSTRYMGKRLALAGTDMTGAPVHSVSWDVDSGETTIEFGPVPELAPADFLELQRRLRARPVTWWSGDERQSNQLGSSGRPSAKGDSVGGYSLPSTTFEPPSPDDAATSQLPGLYLTQIRPPYIPETTTPAGKSRFYLTWGFVNSLLPNNWQDPIDVLLGADTQGHVAVKIFTSGTGEYSHCEIVKSANRADFANPAWNANGGRPAHFFVFLGTIYIADGVATAINEGGGSIHVEEYLTGIDSTGSDVASIYRYGVRYRRINF